MAATERYHVEVAMHLGGSRPLVPTLGPLPQPPYPWTWIYLRRGAFVSKACGLLALDQCRIPSTRPLHCPPGAPIDDGFDRAGPRIHRSPCVRVRGAE